MNDLSVVRMLPEAEVGQWLANVSQLGLIHGRRMQQLIQHQQVCLNTFNEADAAMTQLTEEAAKLHDQRRVWQQQWQHWLNEDGVLYRGDAWRQQHMSLDAWEQDLVERQVQCRQRWVAAEHAWRSATALVLRAETKKAQLDAAASALKQRIDQRLENLQDLRAEEDSIGVRRRA